MVAEVKEGRVLISFRRWLTEELLACRNKIMIDVDNFQLQNSEDQVFWKIGKNKLFSVKSLYNALTVSDNGSAHRIIWKSKVPPKIKIFIWLMTNGAILTKDNLIRRKWVGNPKCQFCDQTETIDHLFFFLSHCKSNLGGYCNCAGCHEHPHIHLSMLGMV